jgi:phenylacetic acid degradation operon negative regulatory protein
LLGPLDIAAPAVRTAISRMVVQDWLKPVRLPPGPGYALTARAEQRLGEAAARIYRRDRPAWDETWHVLVVDREADRAMRERVRNGLAYLGYAVLRDDTWVSPRRSVEVSTLLETEGVSARGFASQYDGDDAALAAQTWDLQALAASYRTWQRDAERLVAAADEHVDDRTAFVVRSRLVHEWRKFLFRDPGLPSELLPQPWPGNEAATYFDAQADRLLPAAGRYVDHCLENPTGANGGR